MTSSFYTEAKPTNPTNAFNGGPGQTEPFSFTANGVPDVTGFVYCEAVGKCTPTTYVAANQLGGSATVGVSPVASGPNDLWVRSVDRAGNQGPPYQSDANIADPIMGYHFDVASGAPALGI